MTSLVFLKLGGSLITDKYLASTPRLEIIDRLAHEINAVFTSQPDLRLIIGHGSGSFGHVAANRYGTRQGVNTQAEWKGFAEVWRQAHHLNQIVIESLVNTGLPVVAFPPSAGVITEDGQVKKWDTTALEACLQHNLIPVVNGDVVIDTRRGGTIVSTEEIFAHLATRLKPKRILLAGIERGVWVDFPDCTKLIDVIDLGNFTEMSTKLQGSAAIDVTGGMYQKVSSMFDLARSLPGLEINIFSGIEPGSLQKTMLGSRPGTVIQAG